MNVGIFLDMDGVVADFNAGCRLAGIEPNWHEMDIPRADMTPEQLGRDDDIRALMATPGFFEELPVMSDAHLLWDFCARWKPVVLTARPSHEASGARCAREKRAWIHRVFGPIPDSRFICTVTSEKPKFIGHTPGPVQILVDDRAPNCEAWTAAGGTAICHATAAESIARIHIELLIAGVPHPVVYGLGLARRPELRVV